MLQTATINVVGLGQRRLYLGVSQATARGPLHLLNNYENCQE